MYLICVFFCAQKLGILEEGERVEDQMLFDIVFKNSELSCLC